MYNPQIHHRRSMRLKNYDYSSAGLYFITLCVKNRRRIFGQIIHGTMQLSQMGEIVAEEWVKTPEIRTNTSLGEYIVMPDHFHAILRIDYPKNIKKANNIGKFHSPTQTIGAIIRGFKGATTRRINSLLEAVTGELHSPQEKGPIWQRDYFDHIITSEKAYRNISNYIINNPIKWGNDKFKRKK